MSLYSIEQDLLELFNVIEENDGEITDDQIEILAIKEEELKDKLDSYRKAIAEWEGDIETCKNEEKRIKSVRDKYAKRIEKLKTAMITAVDMFGRDNKTKGKFIQLPTAKISVRPSTAIEIDSVREVMFVKTFMDIIRELDRNDILSADEPADCQGIVEAVTANVRANAMDNHIPEYNVSDLLMNCSINIKCSLYDLLTKYRDVISLISNTSAPVEISPNTSKTEYKEIFGVTYNMEYDVSTAKVIENKNLNIK